jgi:hypothetical protein
MQCRRLRLAHRWILSPDSGISESLVREFIRPAVRAVPSSMAWRLGPCRIALLAQAELDVTSRWTTTTSALEVSVTTKNLRSMTSRWNFWYAWARHSGKGFRWRS